MKPVRFVMVGGFLGAGKTTLVARLARMYQARGQRVGIVTNDQASDLVDTNHLKSQGFDVGEVAGACFCCNFNELTSAAERLVAAGAPDVILAEPVGSCTDLVATVVQPLVQLFNSRFEVAPYGVILKPSHGRKILRHEPAGGFSPKAAYIFRQQLAEADFVLLNRVDELPAAEREELASLLASELPDVPVLPISARTGEGCEEAFEFLGRRGPFGRRILDIDYDVYAEGEAELGWLNANLVVRAARPFALDDLLLDVVTRLAESLAAVGGEIAHLKVIGLVDGAYGVANVVATGALPELSLPSLARVDGAQLVVNARVAIDPVMLESHVRAAIGAACQQFSATAQYTALQRFRPGRPVPTHRLAAK